PMALPVLWHFTVSHFNEKARWALDFKRVPHVRRALLPGFHFPKILRMTGQTAVPVLALDGRPIHDSTRIIEALERAFPEPALYPRNEPGRRRALALEDFFDEELGPSIRAMLVHAQFVHDPGLTAALFTVGMGRGSRRTLRILSPVFRPLYRFRYKINAASAEVARGARGPRRARARGDRYGGLSVRARSVRRSSRLARGGTFGRRLRPPDGGRGPRVHPRACRSARDRRECGRLDRVRRGGALAWGLPLLRLHAGGRRRHRRGRGTMTR